MIGVAAGQSRYVSSIEPSTIGWAGGAVVINGDGFAEDSFSQFDASLGNKVWGIS